MTTLPIHQTKTELALHVLRERIISGQFEPGQRLRIEEIKTELEMSPTPIREALRLLQADGLVTYRPHRGIVVANVSPQVIADVLRIRIAVEPVAVELAVPRLTTAELQKLEALHKRLANAVRSSKLRPFSEMNASWHWVIYEACDLPFLQDFIRRLWDMVSWRTMWALPGWAELSIEEHDKIMAAIRERDPTLAAERMRIHLSSSREFHLAIDNGDGASGSLRPLHLAAHRPGRHMD
jgi:DNA-binding GntR family transcriptional regulator